MQRVLRGDSPPTGAQGVPLFSEHHLQLSFEDLEALVVDLVVVGRRPAASTSAWVRRPPVSALVFRNVT
jgi:hypothetical protein